jgi:hypothetical protein
LWCFGLCHGCTMFDLAAVTQRSNLEQSHGAVIAVSFTLPPDGRKGSSCPSYQLLSGSASLVPVPGRSSMLAALRGCSKQRLRLAAC